MSQPEQVGFNWCYHTRTRINSFLTKGKFVNVNFSYSDADIAELLSEFTDPQTREALELASLPEILVGATYFIDVGANVGQYVFHAAKYLRNAKVVAVEANPLLIPELTNTVQRLRSSDSDNEFEVKAAAVSDIPERLKFHISKYPTLSSMFPNGTVETVDVPTVTLDYFYRESEHTVIKIDVEGAEYRAVRSGQRFLQSNCTTFFVELHSWGDRNLGKYPLHVCWLFMRRGYSLRKVGTHYLFHKASFFRRVSSFSGQFPALAMKYLICRYGGFLRPTIDRLRRRITVGGRAR